MIDDLPASVAAAHISLERACDALDQTLLAMAADRLDNDTVMASPRLVALLLDVVRARRQVKLFDLHRRDAMKTAPSALPS